MSSVLKPVRLSREDYFALEQAEDQRYEYSAGDIFLMAGGSESHALIAMNIGAALVNSLRGKPCRVYGADMKLYVPEYDWFCYPDVQVLCEQGIRHEQYVENPVLIVEVLSASTENYDRGQKFERYRNIAGLQYYLLVDQYHQHLEFYQRQSAEDWLFSEPQQTVWFPLWECGIEREDIYRQVEFIPMQ